jgi:kinetochore protein NDC80
LTRPAVKDFNNIAMFLFRQIDPYFTCTGKFEDEVVAFFKFLGYPCQISKANIAAVGSPHAWPSLLAAIMWLIELLTYDEVVIARQQQDDAAAADFDDPATSEKAFYSYLGNAYGLFLSGEDARYAELEEQFVGSSESKNVLTRDQTNELDEQSAALAKEIGQVEARRAYLPELEAKKKDYLNDLGKFEQLVEELERHKEKLETQVKKRDAELSRLASGENSMEDEINALQNRVNTQELSPEDVKRMVAERERLQQAQEQASENRQALQRRVWEAEMAYRDRLQALDDCARAYNSVAEDLKLVPSSAKNARGRNLMLEVDIHAKKRDGLLRTDARNALIPALQTTRVEFSERNAALRNELLSEQDTSEDLHTKASELQEQQAIFEGKLKRAEEAYRREKEGLDQSVSLHTKEMEAMETRLVRLRDTAAEEVRAAAAGRRAAEARAAREVRRSEHHRKKQEMLCAIMEVVSSCASHRELVSKELGEVKDMYAARLESVIAGSAADTVASLAAIAMADPAAFIAAQREEGKFSPQAVTTISSSSSFAAAAVAPSQQALPEAAFLMATKPLTERGNEQFSLPYPPNVGRSSHSQNVSATAPVPPTGYSLSAAHASSYPAPGVGVGVPMPAASFNADRSAIASRTVDAEYPREMISGPSTTSSFNFAGLLEACAKDDQTLLTDESTILQR